MEKEILIKTALTGVLGFLVLTFSQQAALIIIFCIIAAACFIISSVIVEGAKWLMGKTKQQQQETNKWVVDFYDIGNCQLGKSYFEAESAIDAEHMFYLSLPGGKMNSDYEVDDVYIWRVPTFITMEDLKSD